MSRSGNTFLALIAGGAIGAIAGILYAPEKGSVTRQNLKDGIDEAKNNLKSKLDNATSDIKGKFADANFGIEETYENLLSSMSHKADDIISFLETKLANLKEQNAKFQKDNQQKNQYSE